MDRSGLQSRSGAKQSIGDIQKSKLPGEPQKTLSHLRAQCMTKCQQSVRISQETSVDSASNAANTSCERAGIASIGQPNSQLEFRTSILMQGIHRSVGRCKEHRNIGPHSRDLEGRRELFFLGFSWDFEGFANPEQSCYKQTVASRFIIIKTQKLPTVRNIQMNSG